MNDKDQKKEDSAKTKIKKQYNRLKDALTAAKEKREEMEALLTGPIISKCVAEWKREIQAAKESLVNAEPKEVIKLQQSIKARTALIEDFENEWKKEVEDAQNEMDQFQKEIRDHNYKNPLFEAILLEELPEDERKAAKKAKKGKQPKPSDNVTPIQATA